MSGECMSFPATPAGFIESYSFKDKEQVYTNGVELIPVFRVEQMVEHYFQTVHAYWYGSEFDGYADGGPVYDTWGCSCCHEEVNSEGFPPLYDYCPHCGAKMDGEVPEC